jgi:hypothetical protein
MLQQKTREGERPLTGNSSLFQRYRKKKGVALVPAEMKSMLVSSTSGRGFYEA